MKKVIRLTEGDLHRIVRESVNRVMMKEGMLDKLQGAYNGMKQGFSKGNDKMNAEKSSVNGSANSLRIAALQALKSLEKGEIQSAIYQLNSGLKWDNHFNDNANKSYNYGL